LIVALAVTVMVSCSNQRKEHIEHKKYESSLFLYGKESHRMPPSVLESTAALDRKQRQALRK
jgi:hypothetical protein